MAQVQDVLGGGMFLTRSLDPDSLFTREDLTDEQRLFGQTAAEFMRNEVLPNEASLYAHDWQKTRELLESIPGTTVTTAIAAGDANKLWVIPSEITKAMEGLGSLYADRYGLDVVCLRIGSAFPEPTTTRQLSTWLSPSATR